MEDPHANHACSSGECTDVLTGQPVTCTREHTYILYFSVDEWGNGGGGGGGEGCYAVLIFLR